MKAHLKIIARIGKWPVLLLAIWMAAPHTPCLLAAQSPPREGNPQSQSADPRIERMLSIAESQYEIVKLLIQKGRFERVLPEMRKIYELNLPIRYDEAMAKSASLVAHLLAENGQFALAHEALNEAFPKIKEAHNQASLLKIKAYIYKSEGNLEAALETLEKAVALERPQIRP